MSGKHRSGAVAPTSNSGQHRLGESRRSISTAAAVVAAGTIAFSVGAPTAQAVAAELPPDAVAQCESGGSLTAKNPTSSASGKWQIINGTWAANGGLEFAPTARQATEREQDIVAARIMESQGIGAWSSSKGCWGGKSSSSGVAVQAEKPKAKPRETIKPAKKAPTVVEKPAWDGMRGGGSKTPAPVVTPKAPAAIGQFTAGGDGNYTVQSGDTLAKLALDYKVSVDHLMARNSDIVEDPDWIFVGEKLDTTP